jgi:hypothetical protein
MSGTRFSDVINGVGLASGQVIDGTSGELADWDVERPEPEPAHREINFAWYEKQRIKIQRQAAQADSVNASLALTWYQVIRRSLDDLPIQVGGRSMLNPEYGANQRAIALALGLAPRTLSTYRTAVSRIKDEAHFRELIKGSSWSSLVFYLNSSPVRRPDGNAAPAPGGLPLPKRRCLVQIPTPLTDFLMENGLAAPDVTAVVVKYLRQSKVQRELLKMFRQSMEGLAEAEAELAS